MTEITPWLGWLDTQAQTMKSMVMDLSAINTGSYNIEGLSACTDKLVHFAGVLQGAIRLIDLPGQEQMQPDGSLISVPLGQALSIRKHPQAPFQVFLGIHMDTVFGRKDPFQLVTEMESTHLHGPGVVDAKGGIVILIKALEALENSPYAGRIGWEVLINPDEEIGSPGSNNLFTEIARRCQLGLIFEPSLPDGSLVTSRKGSGNFSMVIHGRSAHAGRHPEQGRNAIHLLSQKVQDLVALQDSEKGISVNVARVEGGGPNNLVPDCVTASFNIRFQEPANEAAITESLKQMIASINAQDGYSARLHGGIHCPPKVFDHQTMQLQNALNDCAGLLGDTLQWCQSGGVCDGNRLAARGLPNIDTLGACGTGIHTDKEILQLDSLVARSRLSALFLIRLAKGDFSWALS